MSWLQASITLPSSVFATDFEEEVGLLNKAAPVSGEPGALIIIMSLKACIRRYFEKWLHVIEVNGSHCCLVLNDERILG